MVLRIHSVKIQNTYLMHFHKSNAHKQLTAWLHGQRKCPLATQTVNNKRFEQLERRTMTEFMPEKVFGFMFEKKMKKKKEKTILTDVACAKNK